ncbi:cob(I)yrinic acid a,c-diamide adenosyltransferase [Anoxybacter fermentans]|uniref:Cob(I)yrinic acid a,c-diamide adenosyltransferase n=1 Tax=Anoxybacter fermentans TaxID=1323375 RepID=A0A3S9T1Z0_9FIRM|nr:cob(I)yrinic acid a,c-diamide adenosyltransferase [Anoxybacter fermentans]AZR74578.1 cob(I)yrinic acid a,c-diamide adenosyltransferase [Anoxybacter fermentans]
MRQRLEKGLIQVYTGDGKGKTTAALGLALRAAGHELKVYIIQFMKGVSYSGELLSIPRLAPFIKLKSFGRGCPNAAAIRGGIAKCSGCGACFIKPGETTEEDKKTAQMAWELAEQVIMSDEYDLVILDEVINALHYGLVTFEQIKNLVQNKPELVEIVMTGRNAPQEIVEIADLVTEMKMIKHPFEKGIMSRWGIEY